MKFNFKSFLPYLGIVALFALVACLYCSPELEGQRIVAADAQQPTSAMKESWRYHQQTGDYTWWTGAMFCGMPNYQIGGGDGVLHSHQILRPFKNICLTGHKYAISIVFFYFWAFFLLLRTFKIERWMSVAGAFAIAFSSYFFIIIAASHTGKCIGLTWTIPVIIGFVLIFRKRYGWGAFITMFAMALAFTIHLQMSFYLCMLIGLLFCAELYMHLKEKRYKDLLIATAVFALAFGVGLGANGGLLFLNKEYVTETMRGGHSELVKETDSQNKTGGLDLDYATNWSYGIDEIATFLIPNYMGGCNGYHLDEDSDLYQALTKEGVPGNSARAFCESSPMYWGDQPFTAGPVYMGAVVCFLFVLSLYVVKGPYKWALLAATAFSVMLSWGYHFMPLTKLFYNYFPMYNKFRAVSSILVVAEITIPLLGFMALKAVAEGKADAARIKKQIAYSALITGGICLLFALFGGLIGSFTSRHDAQFTSQIPDFVYNAIIAQRKSLMVSDAWRSLLFVVLGAVLTYLLAADKIKTKTFGMLLALLVLVDMWPVNKRYFNERNYVPEREIEKMFVMKDYEKQLLEDKELNFRMIDLTTNTFNDARPSYYLNSVGGYSAAKLRRYQDLIDEHLSKMNMQVYNMLNTKYFIVPSQGKAAIQQNPDAFGNAWFVDSLVVAADANEENAALNTLDLKHAAVLDKQFEKQVAGLSLKADSASTVKLMSYTPKELNYETQCADESVVVFSEIYYPYGWKSYIDGVPAEHFRADYTLRAMRVPAGKHQIRFVFDPDSARKGDLLATSCIAVMLLTLLGTVCYEGWRRFRKVRSEE